MESRAHARFKFRHSSTTTGQGYPQNLPHNYEKLTPQQTTARDEAIAVAMKALVKRPECRKFVTGKRISADKATKWFATVAYDMTYDPDIGGLAETDEDFSKVRLAHNFFTENKYNNLLVELANRGVKDTSGVLNDWVAQRAYIELHEFQHVATKKSHGTDKEVYDWYQGLYDNCFKTK